MAEKKLNLLAEFPSISTQQWMDKVTADLKGADFDKKLVWKTNEGIAVKPFYRAEDIEALKTTDVVPGKFPFVRGTKVNNEWLVRQDIEVTDAKQGNTAALDVLCRGCTSLGFVLNKQDVTESFIAELLKDIVATSVELNFIVCGSKSADLAFILTDYFKSNNYDLTLVKGSIHVDPIHRMVTSGKDLTIEEITMACKYAVMAVKELPFFRVLHVNAIDLSNAGAFNAQELGYALAWGNQYLSMMIDAGIEPSIAAKKIKFNFGVGGNYFMEIAKFRAAKLLWANIVAAYQPKCLKDNCAHTVKGICLCSAKMFIHAETSTYNKTIFDANVNMLRTQTEAMSATIAGVNSLTVLPYDVTYKNADDFSERIARNQQLLLKEESHFDKVADPAAGSYYIETLTNELAAKAWDIFLATEEEGGFLAAVKVGTVQTAINNTAISRMKSVSSRREVLLGTNQFPNFNELGKSKIETIKTAIDCNCGHDRVVQLNIQRLSTEFEELRFATEAAANRPKAFMLTIGNLNMRLARAQFTCNFFACAGYDVVDNLGFKTIEEGVNAAMEANADIIVLCSSDEEYTELAPAAYEASKGKAILVVAGAPANMDELKSQGIEHFVNVKSNVLDTLKGFNQKLGIN